MRYILCTYVVHGVTCCSRVGRSPIILAGWSAMRSFFRPISWLQSTLVVMLTGLGKCLLKSQVDKILQERNREGPDDCKLIHEACLDKHSLPFREEIRISLCVAAPTAIPFEESQEERLAM